MDKAVTSCDFKIHDKTGQYIFSIISKSIYSPEGFIIGCDDYPTQKLAKKLQIKLRDIGIIDCQDWDCWKMTDWKKKNSKRRRFKALDEVITMNLNNPPWVDSYYGYKNDKGTFSPCKTKSSVMLNGASKTCVPDNVARNLINGTGLQIDYAHLNEMLNKYDDEERHKLEAAFTCSSRNYHGELHSNWNQSICGRIYSRQPNIQGIPSILRSALQSTENLPIFEVDYKQCELRLAFASLGIELSENNQYEVVADDLNIPFKYAKTLINPYFNGQRYNEIMYSKANSNISYDEKKEMSVHAQKLEKYFADRGVMSVVNKLRSKNDQERNYLKRIGAEIFFDALSTTYNTFKMKTGLMLHDGLIFGAEESVACDIKDFFENAGIKKFGFKLPVRLKNVV